LIDATDEESFLAMLESLKEQWSKFNEKGGQFHEWFCKQKRSSFLHSAIAPVRQRVGLGLPPEKFTTNRSEQTNRSIQEFVRKECKEQKKVDEFSFCVALNKLVKIQKQEIELAIVGNGEYRIREKYQQLSVPPEKWNKMN
jgi:dimeric dUTPase (all-alpha-NTP-PPase superfamily)